ncbi:MAG: TetR/AcrR family transcriptional regulator [Epsilonproteobacteria bacterium]|nr:TetR/AcrR family transcriptional regulator [Campylobacterota bacterium]
MAIKEKIKEFKKELVLQKVSQYLETHGFAKAKMADIAAFCGMSVGALYKLFGSKEELFYAYVNYQLTLFQHKLAQRLQHLQSPHDRIKAIIALKFETFQEKRQILKDTIAGDPLFFAKLSANRPVNLQKLYDTIAEEFEKIDALTPLRVRDTRRIAYIFNAITYGYVEYWLVHGGDLRSFVDEAYEILMKGIA